MSVRRQFDKLSLTLCAKTMNESQNLSELNASNFIKAIILRVIFEEFSCFKHVNNVLYVQSMDFPGDSDGEEFTCNAGDLGLIPGLGRSSGEGNGYPLQYSYLENR